MPELRCVVPGAPVPAARPRVTRYGTHNPRRMSDYLQVVRDSLAVEMRRKGLSPAPTGAPVTFVVLAAVPWTKGTRKADADTTVPYTGHRDASNFLKLAEDAGNGVVYEDDAQITRAVVEKWRVPRGEERLEITASW